MIPAGQTTLLHVAEMYRADRAAIDSGIPGERLMEAAGGAIAAEIAARWSPRPVAVLCGPGNNGGDGFVVARLLAAQGWDVRLALLGDRAGLKGDAALNADRWTGAVAVLAPDVLDGAGIVVDAVFGAGLAREIDGAVRDTLAAADERPSAVVAVDTPSGVHGDTGAVLGFAPKADLTVTFCRAKPGHLLLPGRLHCGDLVVADIGIGDDVVAKVGPRTAANRPALWCDRFPWPAVAGHKYQRGHALIVGGGAMTGAARLAARSALRAGAGLVTVAAPKPALPVYQASLASLLTTPLGSAPRFADLLADRRLTAVLLGPGNGVGAATCARSLTALASGRAVALDADALTSFADRPADLFAAIGGDCVMTPHDGEFAALFGHAGDRLSRARAAAQESGAVVVLKGADTVVAAPNGRAAINDNAPPDLATAGAGDVLAGLIVGLLAQGMPAFEAAAAAVWLHGDAAARFGPGLIADDLAETLPAALAGLKAEGGAKCR